MESFRIITAQSDAGLDKASEMFIIAQVQEASWWSGVEVGFLSDRRSQDKAQPCPSKHNKHQHTQIHPFHGDRLMKREHNIIKEETEGELV